MDAFLETLARQSTYMGLLLTLAVLWLLRGMENGLRAHFLWLLAVWVGYILVELAEELGGLNPSWYSTLRKVPGRIMLMGSVAAFLVGIWRERKR